MFGYVPSVKARLLPPLIFFSSKKLADPDAAIRNRNPGRSVSVTTILPVAGGLIDFSNWSVIFLRIRVVFLGRTWAAHWRGSQWFVVDAIGQIFCRYVKMCMS
jgi:hypothetical protein